jgi:hypothetical protein
MTPKRRAMAWEAHQHGIASTYEHAKTLPADQVWQPLHAMKRQADAAIQEMARFESAMTLSSQALADVAAVVAYLRSARVALSSSTETGFCVVEQDGTRLYCALTMAQLADWCRTQSVPSYQEAAGGFRDYMARQ